ncbi:serine dehydratase subunit alpha family protein [Clostridium sp. 'deep sea']|uniref:L-cysteine desulfidase family protein n=1 Tax=Clostridium sp. 'deep sea' TaxID=2779445 RepID=UPI0018969151|nr:L-serine ammonia-lyase, iron-sulfur-dependent, subunit alpha [Clostridium sp. 'deep sea']QOR34273.1 serine dehydratase subunit alpha family protein [Clostridium sp. 'deep sea']
MCLENTLLELIKKQTTPAMGCTEPVAVSLATAYAVNAVGGTVKKVKVKTDPNIYKNGMGVYVPNTGKIGLDVAAAIGAVGGNSQVGLEVLKDINQEHIKLMNKLIDSGNVEVSVLGEPGLLHIIAEVETDKGTGLAEIVKTHENLIRLEANGEVLLNKDYNFLSESKKDVCVLDKHCIDEIVGVIESYNEQDLAFLLEGALMNYKVAQKGLECDCGLSVGANMKELIDSGKLGKDLANITSLYTAAASDARMRGLSLPVMTTNGSGNQGLTATIPVYVAAKELGIDGIKLLRALAISQALTIKVKSSIGLLSALCSCTIAAPIGSASGIIYLLGGGAFEMQQLISSLTADIIGAICDGAKPGCALKVASGVATAVRHALMIMNGLCVPCSNGIVGRTAEECIENIGAISNPGMINTDKTILDIMVHKGLKDKNNEC